MSSRLFFVLLVALSAGFVNISDAAARTRVCVVFEQKASFNGHDRALDMYPGLGDDYLTDHQANYALPGVYVKVAPGKMLPWESPDFDGYTGSKGWSQGCTPYLDLQDGRSFTATVSSVANVGNIVDVRASSALNADREVWDLDGTDDTDASYWVGPPLSTSITDPVRCVGSPTAGLGLGSHDYWTEICLTEVARTYHATTEYDWLRFFWSLVTEEGLLPADIAQIWSEADPDDWWTRGTDRIPGSLEDYPARRLQEAADSLGWGLQWRTQAELHGTCRGEGSPSCPTDPLNP